MGAAERIRHELRAIGLVSLYFLSWFLFFLSMKKLLLSQYEIEVTVLGTAVLGALIVAKVVVLLQNTSFGDRFRSAPLAVHVLWRSFCYTAIVFVVASAERLFDVYREVHGLRPALAQIWEGKDFHHFLAMNLSIGLSFVVYNALIEIDARLGEGGLRRLFLSR